jgi:hypothetical protein
VYVEVAPSKNFGVLFLITHSAIKGQRKNHVGNLLVLYDKHFFDGQKIRVDFELPNNKIRPMIKDTNFTGQY